MKRRQAGIAIAAGAGIAGTALLVARLPFAGNTAAHRGSLLVSSAAPMLPLCRAWAQAFTAQRPWTDIVIEEGGALPAYLAARSGAIDLAALTRTLTDSEDDALARHFLVAKGALDIVVPRASPVTNAGLGQVRALLTGAVADWRAVGGPGLPVGVHAPARGGTARRLAEEVLLDGGDFAPGAGEPGSGAAIVAAVAADAGGIGVIDACEPRGPEVRRLAIDGVPARRATVLSGRYPGAHGFYLLLHGGQGGVRDDFLAFARGPAGQRIVERLGLVPVR